MNIDRHYFPGEEIAIEQVVRLGALYGYGNLIQQLQNAWSKSHQEQGFSVQTSDSAAGFICSWCHVDRRTGKDE